MTRREFLELMALACVVAPGAASEKDFYERPRFGNVHLLHMTDCHAQLLPVHYREPSINIGVGAASGQMPHIVGEALRHQYRWARDSRETHAFTSIDFGEAARRYGKVGGFAHIATLLNRLRADRPNALLLDGGDTWQGSATALWTRGQDMVDACKLLGVDIMTGHWEFTQGAERLQEIIAKDFVGHIDFLAHNVLTREFADPVFPDHAFKELNGVPVAVIGQAFPHTAIAHPARFVPDWTFGLQEERLRKQVGSLRAKGAQVVVLLSHNGMDVDLKLASRVDGIDVILGGHTHDAIPLPVWVKNRSGRTLVTNAGSNGKFVGVVDLDVRGGKLRQVQYTLLPVFADLLPAEPAMQALVDKVREPYVAQLSTPLALTEGMLYRRGNFNGSFDHLLLNALMEVLDAQIAFSPGFRWGTTLLPGDNITIEDVYNQTAISYPATTVTQMTGAQIKDVLEDVCDNLFNPDPYYQQGGDMVRVGGMTYTCYPHKKMGSRIGDIRFDLEPIRPTASYKVASWAPVAQGVEGGQPIWEVLMTYLKAHPVIAPINPVIPRLMGVKQDPGRST